MKIAYYLAFKETSKGRMALHSLMLEEILRRMNSITELYSEDLNMKEDLLKLFNEVFPKIVDMGISDMFYYFDDEEIPLETFVLNCAELLIGTREFKKVN